MKKKASLADLQVKKPSLAMPMSQTEVEAPMDSALVPSQNARSLKKPHISVYLTQEAVEQLTDLGYDLRRKPKELHREAFNLLFAKYGKPQIS
jgi:hypothetical protein